MSDMDAWVERSAEFREDGELRRHADKELVPYIVSMGSYGNQNEPFICMIGVRPKGRSYQPVIAGQYFKNKTDEELWEMARNLAELCRIRLKGL